MSYCFSEIAMELLQSQKSPVTNRSVAFQPTSGGAGIRNSQVERSRASNPFTQKNLPEEDAEQRAS
jgi:hypothetical protein